MKKKKKLMIVIMLLLCLTAGAAFAVLKTHEMRLAKAEAERQAREAAEAAAEKERQEQALAEEIRREKSEWYLILVNSENAMPEDLTVQTEAISAGQAVDERIAEDLRQMLSDCKAAGFDPRVISSFRTRETQQYLYDRTANKADTALPGHSEHECGLAADIIDADSLGWGDPLINKQEEMPAQKWLMEHCSDYGFILRYPKSKEEKTGIIYEPWHYRYVGKKHADTIMRNGLCLEEYLENMEDYYTVAV